MDTSLETKIKSLEQFYRLQLSAQTARLKVLKTLLLQLHSDLQLLTALSDVHQIHAEVDAISERLMETLSKEQTPHD